MGFDLELALVIGTLVTGVVWLVDKYVWRPRREAEAAPEAAREPWYVEYSRAFFPVLLVVLVLRSFVIEPFRIPSGSMMPTLLIGDFIAVSKSSYGLRLPVTGTKILDLGEPERGDVVVFRFPEKPSTDYIKRVVGLPGDEITYVDKHLLINGEPVQQRIVDHEGYVDSSGMRLAALRLREELGEHSHDIYIIPGRHNRVAEGRYIVPEGHYFVMGDNRDNSNDSRFWGPVPEQNLVGKAFIIWMNWDIGNGSVDFSRIGNGIE